MLFRWNLGMVGTAHRRFAASLRGSWATLALLTVFFINEAVAAVAGPTAAYAALRTAAIPLLALVNVFAEVRGWAKGDRSRGAVAVRSFRVLMSLAIWWFQWFYSDPLFSWDQ
jgi:hypothetical protein